MDKPAKQEKMAELQSHRNQSHNLDSQIYELVKFLARRAAQDDYNAGVKSANNQKIKGE